MKRPAICVTHPTKNIAHIVGEMLPGGFIISMAVLILGIPMS
ncbi:hypothetical protein P278_31730 [Zhouia amylolytica AD3]|uniref:Uncharacterized protein n=1 Tax=Zhouia amylolytica AD3 TaxID=1286632 RepID=W2UIL2_9FLAO|nr:hypothetical protein P278_31730 [Zhouia amylolytica AD3]